MCVSVLQDVAMTTMRTRTNHHRHFFILSAWIEDKTANCALSIPRIVRDARDHLMR